MLGVLPEGLVGEKLIYQNQKVRPRIRIRLFEYQYSPNQEQRDPALGKFLKRFQNES
jgi:hypothetical protein